MQSAERRIEQEISLSPEGFYETAIRKSYEVVRDSVDRNTGFWQSAETHLTVNPQIFLSVEEDHLNHVDIRETAINILSLVETFDNLFCGLGSKMPPLTTEIKDFLSEEIPTLIGSLNRPRWTQRLSQDFIDRTNYHEFADPKIGAPEVHFKSNGEECDRFNQNQPDSWALLLMALSRADQVGLIAYKSEEMDFICKLTGYLTHLSPADFKSVPRFGEEEVFKPSSRSTSLTLAQALQTALHFFRGDPRFTDKIKGAIRDAKGFVREDPNLDRVDPACTDGASAAMLMATQWTDLGNEIVSTEKYLEDNGGRLGLSEFPGVKRFIGDRYHKNFDPDVAIGELRILAPIMSLVRYYSRRTLEFANENENISFGLADFEKATKSMKEAKRRFFQALSIAKQYGCMVEGFTPTDPTKLKQGDSQRLERSVTENVVMVGNGRGLISNRAMFCWAASELLYTSRDLKVAMDTYDISSDEILHWTEEEISLLE